MSRFKQAMKALAETGKPIFVQMNATGCALPMVRGIDVPAMFGARGAKGRRQIAKALATLGCSRRYLAAVAAEGAMRHDINGNAVELVSDAHRAWAVTESARIKAKDARKKQSTSASNALSTLENETRME